MIRILTAWSRDVPELFVIFLAAAPPLFILGDITENLDTYLDRGLTRPRWPRPTSSSSAVHPVVVPDRGAGGRGLHDPLETTHREIVAAKAAGSRSIAWPAPSWSWGSCSPPPRSS